VDTQTTPDRPGSPAADEPHPVFRELTALIDRDVAPPQREALRAFATVLLRRLDPEELAETGARNLAGLSRSAFAFTSARGVHPWVVRVFDPEPTDGYATAGSVVESCTDDAPFLVDSVLAELERRDLAVARLMHPVIGVVRDDAGALVQVVPGREAEHRESFIHIELERALSDEERADLEASLSEVLHDVRLVVRDFGPMTERVRGMQDLARAAASRYPDDDVAEAISFLDWLLGENFVLLGYREYDLTDTEDAGRAIKAVPGSGLGILSDVERSSFAELTPLASLDPEIRAKIEDGDLLLFSKTNAHATVHRRARMDYIGIRKVSPDGHLVGEARLLGLFTSKAYMEPATETPLLHRKLERILTAEDLIPGSHDYKATIELFESFPRDELFQASAEDLRALVVGLLQLEKHGGIRVLIRRDIDGRSISIVVALPRDRFNAPLRKRLQQYFLERFHGSSVDYHLSISETEAARIFFTVHLDPGTQIEEVPYEEIEAEVERMARSWEDDLKDALIERVGLERGTALADEYAPRFPNYYKASEEWDLIAEDVLALEQLADEPEGFCLRIGNEVGGQQPLTRVRLYKKSGKVDLSAFTPILEALGLRAVEEIPTAIGGQDRTYIHDFGVLDPRGELLDVSPRTERIGDAIAAVWRGLCEADSLNRLVTLTDLTWSEVEILRALRNYRMRVSLRYTENYRNDAMAEHPQIAEGMVRFFQRSFDPQDPATQEELDEIRQRIHTDLRSVPSLDQDTILRNLLGTIEATVRTNAFVPDRTCLSFKFRSERVPAMPKPAPLFDAFVYSSRMEGVHLRGGMVARGGIRWSDRREDYRTEVLGLMKAQKVKNAVIVPDGSKGGFILRRSVPAGADVRSEVAEHYVTFMRGLLDITDNRVGDAIVTPPHVRAHDEPDPYLVVAADKGTATFSDIANDVSQSYGFWLGDAFASGGSQGYDHKELGITARGAWESVKRHFRELGIDVMTTPFTVVGIGDMSGDVFGNGMLYTPQIRLVCAFDHRSIFIDPDPDPAASFAERRRLFALPRSSWADYDANLLSPGGQILDRADKSVRLSREARTALGIADDFPEDSTPAEIIHEVLKAPVDLLWNGGIGTYVKATDEGHTEVGDRANDLIRVSGGQVRARVVGEGGNLGFTQRGRIEYARSGGLINTDFIDNSAGVDTSDHEVNLKILLGIAITRGELTLEGRNDLLQACATDVVDRVLYDNYLQAQILSQEMVVSSTRVEAAEDLMQQLEQDGELDRAVEFLPTTEEMMERRAAGEGMARPELAVLLAYAKRSITAVLLDSDLPDSPYLTKDLERYFPPAIVERFGHLIPDHPLRRELIATIAANDVVNSQGVTFVSRMVTETGARPAEVVRAFRIARDVTGAIPRWAAIEGLDGVIDTGLQNELLAQVDWLVEATSRWYLVRTEGRELADAVAAARDSFAELSDVIDQTGPDAWREEREEAALRLMAQGVPSDLARTLAFQSELVHGPDIISVAHRTGWPVLEVARGFFLLGARLELDWLEERLDEVPATTRWQRWAKQSMEDDLLSLRRRAVEVVLAGAETKRIDEAVAAFFLRRSDERARFQRLMRRLALEGVNDLAQLTVATRQIRSLVG
jgi:glutamate dehydrogenase